MHPDRIKVQYRLLQLHPDAVRVSIYSPINMTNKTALNFLHYRYYVCNIIFFIDLLMISDLLI